MNKSMFDEVAYRSILEERMNSGLTKLEAMESITDEQVEKRITEKEAIFSCPKCGQKHQTFAKKTFTTHCKECAHKFIVSTERDIPSVKEIQPSEPTSSRRGEALEFPAELGKPSSGRRWAQKQPQKKSASLQQPTEPFWTWRTKLWVVLLAIMFLVVLGSV